PASYSKLVVFNLRQKSLVADPETFRRARLAAFGRGERVGYLAALDRAHGTVGRLRERAREIEISDALIILRSGRGRGEAQIRGREGGAVREYAGALYSVLKLAHVAGPRVRA